MEGVLYFHTVAVRLPGQVKSQAILFSWAGHWLDSMPWQVCRLCLAIMQVFRLSFKATNVIV